jgi:D-lactate dehydrogenase
MKTLIYSSHDYEKSFLQRAAKGKQELFFTNQSLDLHSASDAKGFSAISLFTSDHAMADVLDILNTNGIKYITLRSVGHDHVDLHMANKSIECTCLFAIFHRGTRSHTVIGFK